MYGKKKIFFKARRLVFELINGDLTGNLVLYSNCDNKYCINPDHQYASSSSDFLKKMEEEGYYKRRSGFKHTKETIIKMSQSHKGKKPSKKTRLRMRLAKLGTKKDPDLVAITAEKYFRGEKNACSKLTENQVIEIRKFQNSTSSHELAKHYPVTASHIRSIWRRSC